MAQISVLNQETINKIAAGEVIERPSSVVKELVENAVDAKATAVTVEIRDGGINFIRVTDNGGGIEKNQIKTAFLPHATSKIQSVEDLFSIASLGFRGEALSSIAAVAKVEIITKTVSDFIGIRYEIEGGTEKAAEEIGAPEGTTFIVRQLFFNTPARKKFLKSAVTEAGYINDLMEHLALSHPDISFKFINQGQVKLHTSGNMNLRDIIYQIYGRDIASNLIALDRKQGEMSLTGFLGKPVISRGNRNFENYYINGRYIKSNVISKAIEEAYKGYMMQHKYPFTVLYLQIPSHLLDVNVHPAKMELRFSNQPEVCQFVCEGLKEALKEKELIPEVTIGKNEKRDLKKENFLKQSLPEPFERRRLEEEKRKEAGKKREFISGIKEEDGGYSSVLQDNSCKPLSDSAGRTDNGLNQSGKAVLAASGKIKAMPSPAEKLQNERFSGQRDFSLDREKAEADSDSAVRRKEQEAALEKSEQLSFFEQKLLTKEARQSHQIIGQLFSTYWLVQMQDKLFIIDQHAAHEKVLYERMKADMEKKQHSSQLISPPILLTLSMQEEVLFKKYEESFRNLGYEIEHFGGKEYTVCAVPADLYGIAEKELLLELIDSLSELSGTAELIMDKLASMSCKAAVKGNHVLSKAEAEALIDELLTLENPYNCPHGRPTIISMTKYELERKFKRIV